MSTEKLDYFVNCMAPVGDRSICGVKTMFVVDGDPLCKEHREFQEGKK